MEDNRRRDQIDPQGDKNELWDNGDRFGQTPSLFPATFQDALGYLSRAAVFGIRPGLQRIEQLLRQLGCPQNACPAIHIAGTNGKGSVSSFCAHIGAMAGLKTGWFSSPYLENFNERIRIINGPDGLAKFAKNPRSAEISDYEFTVVMRRIVHETEKMLAQGMEQPTEFELLTAAAFLYFAEQACDLVIIETGLGGRLDSSNVIDKPLASVITALGYDHMDRLGSTLTEIAREKGGIIKQETPLVLYNPLDAPGKPTEQQEALAVLADLAQAKNAPLTLICRDQIDYLANGISTQLFRYDGAEYQIALNGFYQVQNACLAIAACRFFAPEEAIREGLALTAWPGRLEYLDRAATVLLDGAHNPQGIATLKSYLEAQHKQQRVVFLIGVLQDKAYDTMLRTILLQTDYEIAEVICTQPDYFRALDASSLARDVSRIWLEDEEKFGRLAQAEWNGYNETRVWFEHDDQVAAHLALQRARKAQGLLVVFGSLYLLGSVRPLLLADLAELNPPEEAIDD